MSAVFVGTLNDVPPGLLGMVMEKHDELRCQAAIACSDEGVPIGMWLDDDDESPLRGDRFTVFVMLKADPTDTPVLVCEDCAGWMAEAFGIDPAKVML